MGPKDIQVQLDTMRTELREMSALLQRIQDDDVRRVYGDQIRSVLSERVHRFAMAHRADKNEEGKAWLDAFERRLLAVIDQTVSTYQLLDQEEALKRLATLAEGPWPERSVGLDPECRKLVDEVVDQFHNYFAIALGWRDQVRPRVRSGDRGVAESTLRPDKVEAVLRPLSSSVRMEVLLALRSKGRGLTEMAKDLGLKKGHLQFHIRMLVEAGLIEMDRSTRRYDLTTLGRKTLDGLIELMIRVEG